MSEIRDSAIVMPESFDIGLDSLLSGWLHQHYVHTDKTCASNEDVADIPDSIYIRRLKALPTVIDMPYNQIVRSYIDMYVHRRRSLVEYMVGLSNFYFPLFEDALSRYHMPDELKCLPVIESALKPQATSRVGAAGLWQFMPSTGKLMGLEVNSVLDERRDPEKSTDAACRYLLELYGMYNDWTLAIAAYNCGPGNVNKAIKRSGGKMNFWEIYFYLPKETRGYIPAFIAANYVMNYHCDHNLCAVQTELPPVTDTVMVDRMIHFKQIATVLDLPIELIRELNPQYAYDLVPGNYKSSALRLPAQKLYEYIEQEENISAYKADSLLPKNGNYLDFVQQTNRTAATGAKGGATYYVVRSGDTLSKIARKYGTSVAAIKKLNGMKSDRLTPKKRIRVR
jgi:membrane-bound lytic murein transglycosylase D